MTTPTYDLLASTVLTGDASSITFSSINQTYKHLILSGNLKSSNDAYAEIRFNGSSSGYAYLTIEGNSSGDPITYRATSSSYASTGYYTPSVRAEGSNLYAEILDYTGSNQKSLCVRNGSSEDVLTLVANTWNNTAAINQIQVSTNYDMTTGSTLQIYGLAG